MIKDIVKNNIRKMVRALDLKNLNAEIPKVKADKPDIIEEQDKIHTIPNFEGFKKSLIGNNGYLFLINDSNNEIRQHFDQSYYNQFNHRLFIKNFNSNVEYCKNKDIKYFFLMVPDKSYVCKELLPFNIKFIKRNYSLIKDFVPDFSGKLDHTCYWKTDSHINFLGGKELTINFLKHIDKNFRIEDFNRLIDKQMEITNDCKKVTTPYDLLTSDNWSYSDEERLEYENEKTLFFHNKHLKDMNDSLPEKFKSTDSKRATEYYLNENSLNDSKVLIFRDSSTAYLKNFLSIYYREILCYWDHWSFNKEIIEWYKPDIILEIRTERFLENMETEIEKVRLDNKNNKIDLNSNNL